VGRVGWKAKRGDYYARILVDTKGKGVLRI
jgi:hypothetical protein